MFRTCRSEIGPKKSSALPETKAFRRTGFCATNGWGSVRCTTIRVGRDDGSGLSLSPEFWMLRPEQCMHGDKLRFWDVQIWRSNFMAHHKDASALIPGYINASKSLSGVLHKKKSTTVNIKNCTWPEADSVLEKLRIWRTYFHLTGGFAESIKTPNEYSLCITHNLTKLFPIVYFSKAELRSILMRE